MAIKTEDIPAIARGMFKRYKIQIVVILAVVIAIYAGVKLLGNRKEKADPNNYRAVLDIPGVEFEINKDILNISTAITSIEDSVSNLSDGQSYVYKNGTDTYIVFNMRNYFGMVRKNANADIAHSDMSNVVIDNVWFSKQNPKDKVSTRKKISTIDVIASVSYSASLYNDFYGTLTSITDDDGTEYIIFFGVPKKNLERYTPIIDYTVASLVINSDNKADSRDIIETEIAAEEVVVPEDANIPLPDSVTTSQGEASEEVSTVDVVEQDPQDTDLTTDSGNTESEDAGLNKTDDENVTESVPDVVISDVATSQSASESYEQKEQITVMPSWQSLSIYESQYIEQQDTSHAFSSNVYEMLKVGDTGSMQIVNDDLGSVETAYVRITGLYDASETQSLVDEYVSNGLAYYSEFKAPQGCHLEAVKYDVKYETITHSYINVRIDGLDGYNLIFRGNKYDTRTYNIKWFGGEEEKDWYTGYVVFYIVPDGCVDYTLQFGGYGEGGRTGAAWYKVEL